MKVTIVSGSHREQSQSRKVADHIAGVLGQHGDDASIIDLAGNPLPLWDESVWEDDPAWNSLLDPLRRQLTESEALVVIAPEWHGQVPAGLKNFFLLFSSRELGHKPTLIVAVSSGDGGAYPVAELRMSSYKNNRICYLPEHVILRNVETVLNADSSQNSADADAYYRARIEWSLELLRAYAVALTGVRASGITFNDAFKNGM